MAENLLNRVKNYKIIAEDVNEVYKDSGLGDWFGKGGGGGKKKVVGIDTTQPVSVSASVVMRRRVHLTRHVSPQRKPSNSVKKVSQIL